MNFQFSLEKNKSVAALDEFLQNFKGGGPLFPPNLAPRTWREEISI